MGEADGGVRENHGGDQGVTDHGPQQSGRLIGATDFKRILKSIGFDSIL